MTGEALWTRTIADAEFGTSVLHSVAEAVVCVGMRLRVVLEGGGVLAESAQNYIQDYAFT